MVGLVLLGFVGFFLLVVGFFNQSPLASYMGFALQAPEPFPNFAQLPCPTDVNRTLQMGKHP